MDVSVADLLATARVVSLPLARRFRGLETREAVLLRGPSGWTEFSPFVEYDDAEAVAWLRAAVDFGWNESDLGLRDTVRVNATMPAVDAADVPAVLARFPGCRTVKVKVAERGQSLDDDLARVAAVRRELGDEGRIRVDANGGWGPDDAERALTALHAHRLEYAEQPCASVEELALLRERVAERGIRIAADESVRRAEDPIAVARAGAADLIVVKAQPLGGIPRARAIIAEAGLPAVVSSALDTSVGISMGLHLAAALDELPYDCGLGTAALLAADVTRSPLLPVDGALPVRRVEVDEALLERHAASADRRRWWLERLERVALLSSSAGPSKRADP